MNREPNTELLAEGICEYCDAPFLSQRHGKAGPYCSQSCGARANRAKRALVVQAARQIEITKVIVWNNEGQRVEQACAGQDDAFRKAKQARTTDNLVVELANDSRSVFRWTRSQRATGNRWAAPQLLEVVG